MSIYTKTGDNGTTGLFGGTRVTKDSLVIEVLGSIDELNACIGILLSLQISDKNIQDTFIKIQNNLFDIGTIIANTSKYQDESFNTENISFLESIIDTFETKVEPLKNFILPGGTNLASLTHFTRSVCRRTERVLVSYKNSQSNKFVNELKYLNRLSDLLFVTARYINKLDSTTEIIWKN